MRLLTTDGVIFNENEIVNFAGWMNRLNERLSTQKGVKEIIKATLYKDFDNIPPVLFEYTKNDEHREGNCSLDELQLFTDPMSVQKL